MLRVGVIYPNENAKDFHDFCFLHRVALVASSIYISAGGIDLGTLWYDK